MTKRSSLALAAGGLMAAMLPGAVVAQDGTETGSLLFVVSTASGTVDGDTLTLDAVPSVIWFTDRPARDAGHIEPSAFAALWNEGQDSFAADPPNAVVSILDEDTIADATIELNSIVSLTDIVGAGDAMAFTFKVIDGELPQGAIGTVSLFVDDFCGAPAGIGGDGGCAPASHLGDGGASGAEEPPATPAP